MRVGELSRRTGIGVSTLRAWERRFALLQPERSSSGQRMYTEADVERVAAVGRLLSEGLTLASAAGRVAAAGPAALSATQREAFLLHRAVQAAGEGIWVAQQERTRFVNLRMAELLQCSVDELMDRSVFDFLDPMWTEAVTPHLDRLRAGHRQRFEVGLLRSDGSTFVAGVNATPLRDKDGAYDGAVAVISDVTARSVNDADTRFRMAALDATGAAVVAASPDGTIVYANAAAGTLLGWRPEELIGQNGVDMLPSPDSGGRARQSHEGLLAGRSQEGQMRINRRDGSQFPAHITGNPITDAKGDVVAVVGVIRDDTEKHRLEQEVRTQEQQAEIVALLVSRVLNAVPDEQSLLMTEAIEACRRAAGADLAAFLEVTAPGADLMVRITSPLRPEATVIPGGSRSIAGYTALAGKLVVVDDAVRDRRFDLPPAPQWRGPLASAVAAPVMGTSGVRGVVLVGRVERRPFTASSSHFVQSVASVIGLALRH